MDVRGHRGETAQQKVCGGWRDSCSDRQQETGDDTPLLHRSLPVQRSELQLCSLFTDTTSGPPAVSVRLSSTGSVFVFLSTSLAGENVNILFIRLRCSWTGQEALSGGLCRYGNSVECCWGWRQMDWGSCQREGNTTDTSWKIKEPLPPLCLEKWDKNNVRWATCDIWTKYIYEP